MQRKLYFILMLILPLFSLQAQLGGKLDMRLQKDLKDGKIDGNVSLLVKGDIAQIKALTEKLGGIYKYGYGTVASVAIPAARVNTFAANVSVRKIQSTMAKGVALMDTARIRNNIDSAQWGSAPLTDSILGKNVIVGIIDGGIYWQQQDFKNPDGSTRILYIWDQIHNAGTAPLPYNYGTQWTAYDIDHGNCTEVESYGQVSGCASDFGHGTCVAGIASGNGSSVAGDPNLVGIYTGVAPQSNLIVVDIGTSGSCIPNSLNFLSQVSDAVDFIFKKADALGLPCVINTSVGTYYGSHDGNDITTELIGALLNQRNGRCLVAAAGNEGNVAHHLSYNITADTANPTYTLFNYNTANQYVYFDLWADTANFNNAWFTFGGYDSLGNLLGQIPYMNVPTNFFPLIPDSGFVISRTVKYGSLDIGLANIQVTLDSGRYHVEFELSPPSNVHYLWGLSTYGAGTFDLWASANIIGTSDMISHIITPLNDTIVFPANYRYPDFNKTLVSSWQCSDQVITVGNYSNRAGYWDVDSQYVDLTLPAYGSEVVGKRFVTSSFGPTRDNRVKPDVIATGSTILCTGDANDVAITLNPSNRFKVGLGGKDLRNGGTSMASPIVAGIAALYFQKRPTATWQEIKKALICTAVTDSFTGATPNNGYGYGKVNAFQALTNATCIVLGTMDTACTNYSPLANVDTGGCNTKVYGVMDTACVNYNALANVGGGACVAKVYGCTDPNAANFDSLANVSNGNCIYTAIANVSGAQVSLKVIPNPFSGQVTFNILNSGYNFDLGSIEITNALGERIDAISISPNAATYIYNNPKLAAGIYFYLLKMDNNVVKSGKLVAE